MPSLYVECTVQYFESLVPNITQAATHKLNDLTFEDPPHSIRKRYNWQKTGVAMQRKARETGGGSMCIDEMGK